MTIDRDALQLSAEKKLAAIGAINEDQSNRVGGPWVNAPLEAVLDAILPEVQAQTLEDAADDWGSQIRSGGAGSWMRERAAEHRRVASE